MDLIQPLFFKKNWPLVGDDMWMLVKQAFDSGYIQGELAEHFWYYSKEDNPTKALKVSTNQSL